MVLRQLKSSGYILGYSYCRTEWPLYSAGMCTIEGNIGTIAADGTTPHTATTGCAYLRQVIPEAQRIAGTDPNQPAL